MDRKIIHVDMDAFFAAVEQLDNPDLKGKPVIVGGRPNQRGAVSAASYEARKFGVHSGMALSVAGYKCPQGVFLPPNFARYREISDEIMDIFRHYTPLVEPLSLDEAFLDVTGSERLFGPVEAIAREIQDRILRELNLTASVGVAPNKFLAKVASDLQKPLGFVVIPPEKKLEILQGLPVSAIWGVGDKTAQVLQQMGVLTVRDLIALPSSDLKAHFGVMGEQLYNLARGIDDRPVVPNSDPKSMGREVTFPQDVADKEVISATLLELAEKVGRRLRKNGLSGRTITFKIRYSDMKTVSRSITLMESTNLAEKIYQGASRLFEGLPFNPQKYRLVGISLSHLETEAGQQLNLFSEEEVKLSKLAKAADRLRDKYGDSIITRARVLERHDEIRKS